MKPKAERAVSKPTPNPGSEKAGERGCTCAVLDNNYGRGVFFDGAYHWWRNADCPLHGITALAIAAGRRRADGEE